MLNGVVKSIFLFLFFKKISNLKEAFLALCANERDYPETAKSSLISSLNR